MASVPLRVPLLLFAATATLWADERIDKMIARLGEEAAAFERLAPQVLATETLHQRAPRPPKRFRVRVGAAAKVAPELEWQERELVSEYAFGTLDGAMHELRQVVSVDGKKAKDAEKAPERLAAVVMAKDDRRKRELLEQFEDNGLVGAATDFGQFILMFTPRNLERFEFQFQGEAALNSEAMLIFTYKQIDGPNQLTVVDARKDVTRNLGVQGYVYVRAANYQPVLFTLDVVETLGENGIHQYAEIQYKMSPYGAVLPFEVRHRDLRGPNPVSENTFQYTNFRKFGASSAIEFTPLPPKPAQ